MAASAPASAVRVATRPRQPPNQPPPLDGFDPLACDPALTSALRLYGVPDDGAINAVAALAGSARAREHGRLANEHPPLLRTHDRYGHRIDEVEFHPSWHWLMERAIGFGLHGTPWAPDAGPAAHVALWSPPRSNAERLPS